MLRAASALTLVMPLLRNRPSAVIRLIVPNGCSAARRRWRMRSGSAPIRAFIPLECLARSALSSLFIRASHAFVRSVPYPFNGYGFLKTIHGRAERQSIAVLQQSEKN